MDPQSPENPAPTEATTATVSTTETTQTAEHHGGFLGSVGDLLNKITGHKPEVTDDSKDAQTLPDPNAPVAVPEALGGSVSDAPAVAKAVSVDTAGIGTVTETPADPTDTVGAPTPISLPTESTTTTETATVVTPGSTTTS